MKQNRQSVINYLLKIIQIKNTYIYNKIYKINQNF